MPRPNNREMTNPKCTKQWFAMFSCIFTAPGAPYIVAGTALKSPVSPLPVGTRPITNTAISRKLAWSMQSLQGDTLAVSHASVAAGISGLKPSFSYATLYFCGSEV